MTTDRDYERVFVGDYQRSVAHFYRIAGDEHTQQFAFGYFTPDGSFHHGVVVWDNKEAEFISPSHGGVVAA